jgi:hypothetical protein
MTNRNLNRESAVVISSTIDASDRVGIGTPSAITAAKMFLYHIIGYRNERLMWAFPHFTRGSPHIPLAHSLAQAGA